MTCFLFVMHAAKAPANIDDDAEEQEEEEEADQPVGSMVHSRPTRGGGGGGGSKKNKSKKKGGKGGKGGRGKEGSGAAGVEEKGSGRGAGGPAANQSSSAAAGGGEGDQEDIDRIVRELNLATVCMGRGRRVWVRIRWGTAYIQIGPLHTYPATPPHPPAPIL